MRRSSTILLLLSVFLLCACARPFDVCSFGPWEDRPSELFPDYQEVTIPCNIAPLNFYYTAVAGSRFVTTFSAGDCSFTLKGREVVWNARKWARLLEAARGGDITVHSRWHTENVPVDFQWTIHVSDDAIDPFLTYRLIEPGFEVWDDLVIEERCLENFDTRAISDYRHARNQCMNCHIHAQGRSDLSMFYLRGEGGGAILNLDGALRKLSLHTAELGSTVYGEIHPDGRFGVFSTNTIIPAMHSAGGTRMEVYDTKSDLCLVDFNENKMVSFPETAREDRFETFPVFSADGNYVYYCTAEARPLPAELAQVRYSLVRIPFDASTGTLGGPVDTLWSAAAHGASACHPKASPDGRWLLFTVADYGTFPINHPECDLCLLDLQTGETLPMDVVNDDKSDTYHSWSSDAKWFVFTSKRGDGLYGKPYFCHIAEDGSLTRPFLLPQQDPHFYDKMLRSFNVPDLGNGSVGFDAAEIGRIQQDVKAEIFN